MALCFNKYYKVQSKGSEGSDQTHPLELVNCIDHRTTTYLFISTRSVWLDWFLWLLLLEGVYRM